MICSREHEHLKRIEKVHGGRHSELRSIVEIFQLMHQSLCQHMWKEENVLFPYIKQLAKAESKNSKPIAAFKSVSSPIRAMMAEHEIEGENLGKLRALTKDFSPPVDGCTTYRLAFAELKLFQNDLFQHIHLENNILFPKTIEMEQTHGFPQFEPNKSCSSDCSHEGAVIKT